MTAFLVCAGLTFFVSPRINSYKIFDRIEEGIARRQHSGKREDE